MEHNVSYILISWQFQISAFDDQCQDLDSVDFQLLVVRIWKAVLFICKSYSLIKKNEAFICLLVQI